MSNKSSINESEIKVIFTIQTRKDVQDKVQTQISAQLLPEKVLSDEEWRAMPVQERVAHNLALQLIDMVLPKIDEEEATKPRTIV